MTPDLSCPQTRILLALVAVYERDGRATVRTVAREADRSLAVVFAHLTGLRSKGLVTWDDAHNGTLRPLVEVVAHG